MFCKKCGTQIRDDAKFCPKCGTPVKTIKSGSQEGRISESADTPVKSMASNKSGLPKFVIPTVTAVVAVVVVIIVAVVVHSHRVEDNGILSDQDTIVEEYVSDDTSDSSDNKKDVINGQGDSGEDYLSEKYLLELEDEQSGNYDASVYELFSDYKIWMRLSGENTLDDDIIEYTTFELDSSDNSVSLAVGEIKDFEAYYPKSLKLSYMHENDFADDGYHLGWQAYKFVEGSGYEEDTGGVLIGSSTYNVDATSGEKVIGVPNINAQFMQQGIYVIKLSFIDPGGNTVSSILSGIIHVN